MSLEQLTTLIQEAAEIPSFSSFEEVIHPFIHSKVQHIPGVNIHRVPDNNLVVEIPGKKQHKPVALSAHLDKINHFGNSHPERLPFRKKAGYLQGQMDDSFGIGVCLMLARQSAVMDFPPLLILFSEMEESYGLRKHPHLLKNEGKGLHHGIGAERISGFLQGEDLLPSAVITVDTTPLFRGEPGVAIYSKHWEFTKTNPSEKEKSETEKLVSRFISIDPDLTPSNNTNDYLTYGKCLNTNPENPIPSIAIEPAIFPYHQKNERIYLNDIERVYHTLSDFLSGI